MSAEVVALWERGRARWPDLSLSLEDFAARIAAPPPLDHAEDLYLAVACCAQVPGAAAAFRSELAVPILGFVRTVLRDATAEDLANQLVVELLVGDGEGPRLAGYTGRGPLRAWLRMTAVRRALNVKRDTSRRSELDGRMLTEAVGATTDPETAYLKELYGPQFERAFRDAIALLDAASSTLLRLHFGEGLSLGALGAMHGWSKPTASRRVAAAREQLLAHTTTLLRERLALSESEFTSVLRLVRSGLEVSLTGLLKPGAPP